mmetsp:Transcript_25421/g.54961  ORF Transcript_25421/g.54961 Transcript_25421/m.54961 type:complete len:101 (+) Transcript_25421:138-440(+)
MLDVLPCAAAVLLLCAAAAAAVCCCVWIPVSDATVCANTSTAEDRTTMYVSVSDSLSLSLSVALQLRFHRPTVEGAAIRSNFSSAGLRGSVTLKFKSEPD